MKRDWIRLYTDVPTDPKVQRLSAPLFRFWVNCLCLAGQFDGHIPPIDDLAFRLRVDRRQVVKWVDELLALHVFDAEGSQIKPHNWASRQYVSDISNERVRKFRQRERNVTSNATVTPSEADTETETETEQRKTPKSPTSIKKSARTRAPFRSEAQAVAFAEFWDSYWLKKARAAAEKAYAAKIITPAMHKRVMVAVLAQSAEMLAKDPPSRPHAASWINGRRWEDEVISIAAPMSALERQLAQL